MIKNKGIIRELKEKYGIEIKSSQQLNKIMEKLGLIENPGQWWQTELGMKFSPFRSRTTPANEWLEGIVDYIAEHLLNKD